MCSNRKTAEVPQANEALDAQTDEPGCQSASDLPDDALLRLRQALLRANRALPTRAPAPPLPAGIEASIGQPTASPPRTTTGLLTGVVEDTHHPELPGRVFVTWQESRGKPKRAWLSHLQGIALRRGDRVLLTRPDNEPQWLVIGVLAASGDPGARPQPQDEKVIRLESDQGLRIEAHDGTPLLHICGNQGELCLRPLSQDLSLAVPGRLRLSGRAVELEAGIDGVDLRTQSDVIIRGRAIRLN